MPNWCENTVQFHCDDAMFKEIMDYCLDEEGNFDFNKIVPMPESLDIEAGSRTVSAMLYYISEGATLPFEQVLENFKPFSHISPRIGGPHYDELYKQMQDHPEDYDMFDENLTWIEAGRIYVNNYINYRATDWYQWRRDNWNVKWNASDTNVSYTDHSVFFMTPWNVPAAILQKLSTLFDDVLIQCFYNDECEHGIYWFCGDANWIEGQAENEYDENGWLADDEDI